MSRCIEEEKEGEGQVRMAKCNDCIGLYDNGQSTRQMVETVAVPKKWALIVLALGLYGRNELLFCARVLDRW